MARCSGRRALQQWWFPHKDVRFGESYSETSAPQSLIQAPQPTLEERRTKGLLEFLDPCRAGSFATGNILRVFERGGKRRLEVGLPDREGSRANLTKA